MAVGCCLSDNKVTNSIALGMSATFCPLGGHLKSVLFATMDNAARWQCKCLTPTNLISSGYPPSTGIVGSYGSLIFWFFRNFHAFSSSTIYLATNRENVWSIVWSITKWMKIKWCWAFVYESVGYLIGKEMFIQVLCLFSKLGPLAIELYNYKLTGCMFCK